MDVGYYAPAARTTLNLAVFIVFLSEIDLRLANPRVHTLWARAGAFRHPAVVCSTTTFGAPGRGTFSWSHFIIFFVPMVRVDDVEMTEGVASSTPHASRVPAPGATVPVEQPPSVAARAARQQETGRPSRAPSQAASGGALAAARELLRNPPAEAASPDALRQWRDDVDRLLHMAQAPPVLQGLGNDLRLAMRWHPTTGARAVRRHPCAPPP